MTFEQDRFSANSALWLAVIAMLLFVAGCGSGSAGDVNKKDTAPPTSPPPSTEKSGGDSTTSSAPNEPPATSEPVVAKKPLTEEQALAEIKKIKGQVYYDDKLPDKPLFRIWLQNPLVDDNSLTNLQYFKHLRSLHIVQENSVTDAGMKHVARLAELKDLNLEGTHVTDTGVADLKGMKNLESLSLIATKVTDAGLVHLQGLKRLRRLKLSFTEVGDDGLVQLHTLGNLRSLELDDTKVTREGVSKFKQALPKCDVLTNFAGTTVADVQAIRRKTSENDTPGNVAGESSFSTEWHQWRGPNRDGISSESGLLQEWPEAGPPLKWETAGIAFGYSTLVVHQGKLFTSGCRSGKTLVTALEEASGRQLWQVTISNDGKHRALSTPTIDGDYLYALAWEGDLVCLKHSDGTEVWRRNLAKEFGGKYQSPGIGGGYSESVLIDGDRLVCTPGGADAMIVALDKMSGNTLWQAKCPKDVGPQGIDAAGFSSPVVSNACGIRQYVQLVGRGLMSVSTDGNVLWTYNRIANKFGNIPTPIVQGDYVFASTAHANDSYAGTALLKVVAADGGLKAEEVYRVPERVIGNHHGGMVLIGDHVYMGHGYNRGFPLCLEMKTGKVVWKPGRGPGTGSAGVVYADGCLYFRYEDGTVALVQATPEAYVLKGKFHPPPDEDTEWAHPVVAGGCLYLRGQDKLLCYDVTRK